jgi:hypothetical protein
MAATTEAVAMMVKAVKMRANIANKLQSWVCSRLIILVKVLVKVIQLAALSFILATNIPFSNMGVAEIC